MKKVLLATMMIAAMSLTAVASEVGIQGGLGSSKTNFSYEGESASMDSVSAPVFGIYGVYSLNETMGIELGLSQKTSGFSATEEDMKVSLEYKETIIDSLFRYSVIKGVSLGAGAYVALPSSKVTATVEHPVFGSMSEDGETDLFKTSFGAVLSVRGALPITDSIALTAEGKYLHGLSNIQESEVSVTTRSLQALAGVQYSF